MVQPWQRVTRQKVTQSFSANQEISFPPLASDDGQESPMVVEAEVGGHLIHRMYMDGGFASEVLYEHCFSRLRLEIKGQMTLATTPLLGFSREISWPLGQISLMVSLGDNEHSTSALMNFMVVRSPSPYNGIISRPGFRKIQVVPSTAHGMLKFPVREGIVILHNSIVVPTECRMIVEAPAELPPNEPTIVKGNLVALTGVPRSIVEHRLNIREGCPPIRQKKGLSTRSKQSHSRRGDKVGKSVNHERSALPQLALKPGHGKEA
ncbi:hypothetical protein Tco_1029759 [Tanacetum coccineum]|uniref:Reverse transcriptase domain-containing protein n=1 Tax=Tanacetum coccineum TaxID=301880 RepID=A0ABQ5G5K3_9ASTR